MNIIERDLTKIAEHSSIPKTLFMNLLSFCLNECNCFQYENKYYRQKHGLFMGSSLAPILVERVIEDAVDNTLSKIGCAPDFWFIYVDDQLLSSVPANKVNEINDVLNSYHPKVQFTTEVQEDNKINFLDTTLIKDGDRIWSKWYHKPMASNRMLNYFSAHPFHTK